MSKESIKKLQIYVETMKARLSAPIPAKYVANPAPYKAWLQLEIDRHTKKIESLK